MKRIVQERDRLAELVRHRDATDQQVAEKNVEIEKLKETLIKTERFVDR